MTEEEFWEDQKYDYVARDLYSGWYSFLTSPSIKQTVWDIEGEDKIRLKSVPLEWNDHHWSNSLKVRPSKVSSTPVVENAGKPIADLINEIQGISDEKIRKAVESAVTAARYPECDNFSVEAQRQVAQSDMASEVIAECIEKIKKHFDI